MAGGDLPVEIFSMPPFEPVRSATLRADCRRRRPRRRSRWSSRSAVRRRTWRRDAHRTCRRRRDRERSPSRDRASPRRGRARTSGARPCCRWRRSSRRLIVGSTDRRGPPGARRRSTCREGRCRRRRMDRCRASRDRHSSRGASRAPRRSLPRRSCGGQARGPPPEGTTILTNPRTSRYAEGVRRFRLPALVCALGAATLAGVAPTAAQAQGRPPNASRRPSAASPSATRGTSSRAAPSSSRVVTTAARRSYAASVFAGLAEVDARIPSLVVSVADSNGKDVVGADILLDGVRLPAAGAGRAFTLDPGPHVLRASGKKVDPVEERIVVRERERERVIKLVLRSQEPPPRPPVAVVGPPPRRTIPALSWVLGGVAVVGGAGSRTSGPAEWARSPTSATRAHRIARPIRSTMRARRSPSPASPGRSGSPRRSPR